MTNYKDIRTLGQGKSVGDRVGKRNEDASQCWPENEILHKSGNIIPILMLSFNRPSGLPDFGDKRCELLAYEKWIGMPFVRIPKEGHGAHASLSYMVITRYFIAQKIGIMFPDSGARRCCREGAGVFKTNDSKDHKR